MESKNLLKVEITIKGQFPQQMPRSKLLYHQGDLINDSSFLFTYGKIQPLQKRCSKKEHSPDTPGQSRARLNSPPMRDKRTKENQCNSG